MKYAFSLQGASTFRDSDGSFIGAPDAKLKWPIEFWLGAWDPDALSGFIREFLGIPMVGLTPKDASTANDLSKLAATPSSERT